MKAGKLPTAQLQEYVLNRFCRRRADVLVHAGIGEDCAVIDFGAEVCVVSTDPITGASAGAGRIAVHVSCNDVAANGATPIGVQVVLLLPAGTDGVVIARLMDEVEAGCAELGIEILGGHTEMVSTVSAPIVVTTAIGRAPRDRYVTSAGAKPGDAVVVTKGVGIEGTAILAGDWAPTILAAAQRAAAAGAEPQAAAARALLSDPHLFERARAFSGEISAVRDGLIAAAYGVSAMHDVTEGGLYGALSEMAHASGCGFLIEAARVPVRAETRVICACLGLDPLGLISSGTMLITCPDGAGLVQHLAAAGIPAYVIGTVVAGSSGLRTENGAVVPLPERFTDELWRFLAAQP
jgi:hydrogenase expression/formation protein HypE